MTLEQFLQHTRDNDAPEVTWKPSLRALWYAAKGNWKEAHSVTQEEKGPNGAWVHAHLHREEGDISNARYWYARSGHPESEDSIEEERKMIITLLVRGVRS